MRRVWVAVYEDNVFFLASALTFDALVAALPFTLLALGALGYVVQDDRDTLSSVHALLDRFLPMRAGAGGPMDPAERVLAGVTESRGQLSALGVPLFIWFSTRFYAGVRAGLNDVFDTEESRPWLVSKAVDFALAGAPGHGPGGRHGRGALLRGGPGPVRRVSGRVRHPGSSGVQRERDRRRTVSGLDVLYRGGVSHRGRGGADL
ncbi:MAG: YihY/virulence factor BrkB family protein [Gemmatimonadetes bacterium]|nr:YihY/virulence factor BrkB family protein [Gemmatimonadota bacterium]MBI2614797.1 YihY/virulence factor BrkB family protein [Gemmatimonadota bacterium]